MPGLLFSSGIAGLALVVIAALCLRGRDALIERHPAVVVAHVTVAMASGGLLYCAAFSSILWSLPRDPLVAGAFFGLAFGAIPVALGAPVLLLMFLVDPKFRLHLPDLRMSMWMGLAAFVGCVVSGILFFQFLGLLRASGMFALLLVPVGVALFPFLRQLFRAPALLAGLRRRQARLEPSCAAELRGWADALAGTYRLGKIEVLFGPAKVANAAAVGFWPFTRFIMIGDGLTAVMSPRELRAILTHELAHVLRSDVRNQTLLWIGLGSVWIYTWAALAMAGNLRGPLWAVASSIGWFGVTMLAGLYSRRCELAADRLAAELMDAPEDMRDALTRLGTLTMLPSSKRSITHPSLNERVAALNGL